MWVASRSAVSSLRGTSEMRKVVVASGERDSKVTRARSVSDSSFTDSPYTTPFSLYLSHAENHDMD